MIEESEPTKMEGVDLTGIHEAIHPYLIARAVGATQDEIDEMLASARMVLGNKDGSVIVKLRREVEVRKRGKADPETTDRIRLRPIRAKDYIDETARKVVEEMTFGPSLAMAEILCDTPSVIGELDLTDAMTVFLAMWVARGNWFGPKT